MAEMRKEDEKVFAAVEGQSGEGEVEGEGRDGGRRMREEGLGKARGEGGVVIPDEMPEVERERIVVVVGVGQGGVQHEGFEAREGVWSASRLSTGCTEAYC